MIYLIFESYFWFHQSLPLALVGCNNAIIGIPRQRSSKLWPIKCFHQWGWEWPLFCGGTLPDLANQILQLWLQKKGKLLPSFPSNDASLKPFRILIGQQNIFNFTGTSMTPGFLTPMEEFMLSLKCWGRLMMVMGELPWVFFPLIMRSLVTEEITPASRPVAARHQ